MSDLRAVKIPSLLLEPVFDKPGNTWQSHHVTNPTVLRPSFDARVYLGYRAGGDRDHYCLGDIDVWSSSLGLAILDETGSTAVCRFPWPILRIERKDPLPQSPEQYEAYRSAHAREIVVMHDFRLFEHDAFLYVIFHDGLIDRAFDRVARMSVQDFADRIHKSETLAYRPAGEIETEWRSVWAEAWEPCGFKGGYVYPHDVNKNDIVFFELDGGLEMMHRPLPDTAVLPVSGVLGAVTPDDETDLGVLEACVRPGYFDNSHIGPNGLPTRAMIGKREVFIDVCHGVHNRSLAKDGEFEWKMIYLPYFRVKDAATGDPLYYSDEPILGTDEVWREYSEQGRWVRLIPHLHIIFAGGQIPMEQGKNGLDDRFSFYAGAGDTAIGRAEFTIRDLLPQKALEDILDRPAHRDHMVVVEENRLDIGEASGWRWAVHNVEEKRCVAVTRTLARNGRTLSATRPFHTVPGRFDADAMVFDGTAVRELPGLGICILYVGFRWTEGLDGKRTTAGFGLLMLDPENPERTLYRSSTPIDGRGWSTSGWVADGAWLKERVVEVLPGLLGRAEQFIPAQVAFEIRRSNALVSIGKHWRSHHTLWLRKRAGLSGWPFEDFDEPKGKEARQGS
jgi:hypothetical protein